MKNLLTFEEDCWREYLDALRSIDQAMGSGIVENLFIRVLLHD
jgi:hypothetical protein